MTSKTLKLNYESKTFVTLVRPPDWSFAKLQKVIQNKAGISFPDECYLRVSNLNDDIGQEALIYSQATLKSALDQLNDKKVIVTIHDGNPPSTNNSHECVVFYVSADDENKKFSLIWNKGQDFDIDEFFDELINEIQDNIDFGNDDIVIDCMDDLFESSQLVLFHCNTFTDDSIDIDTSDIDNNSDYVEKASLDEFEDLMAELNEDDDVDDVYLILKQV